MVVHAAKVNSIRDELNVEISYLKVEVSMIWGELVIVETDLLHTRANYNKDLRKTRSAYCDQMSLGV